MPLTQQGRTAATVPSSGQICFSRRPDEGPQSPAGASSSVVSQGFSTSSDLARSPSTSSRPRLSLPDQRLHHLPSVPRATSRSDACTSAATSPRGFSPPPCPFRPRLRLQRPAAWGGLAPSRGYAGDRDDAGRALGAGGAHTQALRDVTPVTCTPCDITSETTAPPSAEPGSRRFVSGGNDLSNGPGGGTDCDCFSPPATSALTRAVIGQALVGPASRGVGSHERSVLIGQPASGCGYGDSGGQVWAELGSHASSGPRGRSLPCERGL